MAEQKIKTIDTSELAANSNVSKEKTIAPVVDSSSVKKRKKSMSEKFSNLFVSEDAGDVKSYLVFDILVPALKDTISDMVQGGIDALLYGDSGRPRSQRGVGGSTAKVSYQKFYDQPTNRRSSREPVGRVGKYNKRVDHDFRDIIFPDKRDAVAVLDGLVDLTMAYEFATVMDLNQLAGQESNFTDNDYGWEDLRGARVLHVRGGYILDLPTPIPVD